MKTIKQMSAAELLVEVASIKRAYVDIGRQIIAHGEKLLVALRDIASGKSAGNFGGPVELKRGPGSSSRVSGYASVFNVLDHGKDTVMRGAFAETLRKHQRDQTAPVMLWSHNMDEPIGVWKNSQRTPTVCTLKESC